jgi:large subunit ribosomal protein L17
MVVSLLQHERIQTTLAKGKELRRWADKIITLGKKGNLHARRQAFALLRNEGIVKKLFDEIAPKLKDREGGYTRIYKMGWRPGDAAPLSFVELATYSSSAQKKSPVKKAAAVLEKVAPKKKEKGEGKEKAKGKEKEKKEKKLKKAAKETPKEKKEKTKKKSSEEKSKPR